MLWVADRSCSPPKGHRNVAAGGATPLGASRNPWKEARTFFSPRMGRRNSDSARGRLNHSEHGHGNSSAPLGAEEMSRILSTGRASFSRIRTTLYPWLKSCARSGRRALQSSLARRRVGIAHQDYCGCTTQYVAFSISFRMLFRCVHCLTNR